MLQLLRLGLLHAFGVHDAIMLQDEVVEGPPAVDSVVLVVFQFLGH